MIELSGLDMATSAAKAIAKKPEIPLEDARAFFNSNMKHYIHHTGIVEKATDTATIAEHSQLAQNAAKNMDRAHAAIRKHLAA